MPHNFRDVTRFSARAALLFALLFASACSSAPVREGKPEAAPEARTQQPPAPPLGAVRSDNHVGPTNPRAWSCSIHVAKKDFKATGPTQMEANQLAIQSCMQKNPPEKCQAAVKCKASK